MCSFSDNYKTELFKYLNFVFLTIEIQVADQPVDGNIQ